MSDPTRLPASFDDDLAREPEAPGRIRWEHGQYSSWYGDVGTHKDLFVISWRTQRSQPDWVLSTRLSGWEGKRAKGNDLDALKAVAEDWLAEFVASLGAVFRGSAFADEDPLTAKLRSATVGIIGTADGMRKVTAPRPQEWAALADGLSAIGDELCALLPENADWETQP